MRSQNNLWDFKDVLYLKVTFWSGFWSFFYINHFTTIASTKALLFLFIITFFFFAVAEYFF